MFTLDMKIFLNLQLSPALLLSYPDSAGVRTTRRCRLEVHQVSPKGMRVLTGTSLVVALLQSLCTAVLTVSAIRVAIGLTALAASGIAAPLLAFHRDALRIPMLALATAGAVVNLLVLAWIWRLRARPSAQWRKREISRKERVSERLQVALSILTLVLVALESWSHVIVHRPPPPPPASSRIAIPHTGVPHAPATS